MRTSPTSTPSRPSWPSTSTAGPTPCAPAQFDVMHTANADTIAQFLEDDSLETIDDRPLRRDRLHHAQRRRGPRDDRPRGRQRRQPDAQPALPQGAGPRHRPGAARRGAWRRHRPRRPTARSRQGSIGYLEDTGYPAYDLDAAQERDGRPASRSRHRQHRVHVQHDERPVQRRDQHADHLDVARRPSATRSRPSITPIEQGQYIGLALFGDFQAFAWRNHGGLDPDQQRLWWQSASSTPIGEPALNFGRFKDDVIDENLEIIKHQPRRGGPHRRPPRTINRRFGEQVYNLWLTYDDVGHRLASRTSTASRCQHPARRHRGHRPGLRRSAPAQPDLVRRRRLRVDDAMHVSDTP